MIQREQIMKQFREVLDASYMLKPEDFDLRDHVELKCKLDKMEHATMTYIYTLPRCMWVYALYVWFDDKYVTTLSREIFENRRRQWYHKVRWRSVF